MQNKLEYTIRCIESVRRYTRYGNYEHIIINNNSSDGTKEWFINGKRHREDGGNCG